MFHRSTTTRLHLYSEPSCIMLQHTHSMQAKQHRKYAVHVSLAPYRVHAMVCPCHRHNCDSKDNDNDTCNDNHTKATARRAPGTIATTVTTPITSQNNEANNSDTNQMIMFFSQAYTNIHIIQVEEQKIKKVSIIML